MYEIELYIYNIKKKKGREIRVHAQSTTRRSDLS